MNSAEHFKKTQVSKKKDTLKSVSFFLEATPGFEPGNQGFADPCLTTWLCHQLKNSDKMQYFQCFQGFSSGI